MAQNKRFLGLGFTFSATDKGLEKKLKNIKNLFQDINLSTGGMAKSIPKIKIDNVKVEKERARLSSSQNIKTGIIRDEKPEKEKIGKDNLKKATDIADAYTKALGDEFGPAYKKMAFDIIKDGIESGRSIDSIIKRLKDGAEKSAESATKMSTQFKIIERVVGYIRNWSKDVINRFETFLDTLGINLRDLFPKELTAAFGVLGALVRPLKDFASVIMSKFIGDSDKKLQDKLTKKVSGVSSAIGEDKSKMNVQESLNALYDWFTTSSKSGKENDKGKLGKFAAGLAGIPIIGALIKYIPKLISAFTFLWEIVSGAGTAIRTVFQTIRSAGAGTLVAIYAISNAFMGFVSEIGNWKDSFISMFDGIFSLIKNIGEYIFTWIQVKLEPLSPIIDMVTASFKFIGDIFYQFGKNFAKLVGMVWDITGSYAKSAAMDVKTATRELKMQKIVPNESPIKTISNGVGSFSKGVDSNTSDLVDLSKKTNSLMEKLIDAVKTDEFKGPNAQNVRVDIRTNSKEISAGVRKRELDYATVTGNSQ